MSLFERNTFNFKVGGFSGWPKMLFVARLSCPERTRRVRAGAFLLNQGNQCSEKAARITVCIAKLLGGFLRRRRRHLRSNIFRNLP
jgi:hypothetical protein